MNRTTIVSKTFKCQHNYKMLRQNSDYVKLPIYINASLYKKFIFKDNKDKSLIYRWVNKINNKSYVGSCNNFTTRFYKYYSINYIKNSKTPINKALYKYGHKNFMLEILEYCDKDQLITKEQYYIDYLNPEYNILRKAGSSLGYKHKKDTLNFFKTNRKLTDKARENLSIAASNRVLTEEEKQKLSESHKGKKLSLLTRNKISNSITKLKGIPVIIEDTSTNLKMNVNSLTEAAKYLNVSRTTISKSLNKGFKIKNRYFISKY